MAGSLQQSHYEADLRSGTLFRASQFVAEELPIRLAHRVQELNSLPDGLGEMPSIQRVRDWYAQSFEVSEQPHNSLPPCVWPLAKPPLSWNPI